MKDFLNQLVKGGLDDFLTSIGTAAQAVTLMSAADTEPQSRHIGVISFNSEHFQGSMVVQPEDGFLVATDPLTRDTHTEHEEAEWLRELTNRMMGCVKARISAHGPRIVAGLPTVAVGRDMILFKSQIASYSAFRVDYRQSSAYVMWCVILQPGFHLEAEATPQQLGVAGQGIVF